MQYTNGMLFDSAYSRMYSPGMTIASRLDEAMREAHEYGPRGISQSALNRKSGVPQATISRTLKGQTDPEIDTIRRLAAALDVTFEWLNEGIPPKRRGGTSAPSLAHNPPAAPDQDQATIDEGIELLKAYRMATKKEREQIMSSAKTAAERATRRRRGSAPNQS
jgi:transcriptional regulator with XRE-family HTH domain